jgi:hypothetical protein
LKATLLTGQSHAQGVPSFSYSFDDAITGDNEFFSGGYRRWDVDPGSDKYAEDVYERPMNQSFGYNDGRYSTNSDYFGNLDIVRGEYGYDSTYAYFAIHMFSTNLEYASGGSVDQGLKYHYRIRVSLDSSGAGGYLFSTDTPYDFGTNWHTQKNFVYKDTNGDLAVDGNGYNRVIASDGLLSGTEVFWTRLRPGDSSVVEFAVRYESFGLTSSQLDTLPYLVFEANKGLLDPQNYLWNKEYTASEAGSPNGGAGGLSEFGTQGLGNIYELDTLRAGAIPEPSTSLLISLASLGMFYRRRI